MRQYTALSIASLILVGLACAYEQRLGSLSPDCSPTSFVLRGEIDPSWEANVEPSTDYTVTVAREDSTHPMNQLGINIADSERNPIAYDPAVIGDTASLSFTGPLTGEILIVVWSKIGEDQEDLGTFSITLCESR